MGEEMASGEVNPWQLAQSRLQKTLDEHSYKNWFSQTRFEGYEDGCLSVGVPSQFFADWLRDHYLDAVHECVQELVPNLTEVRFLPISDIAPSATRQPSLAPPKPQHPSSPPRNGLFNPRYVFARFVVGSGNRFAHAAAKAVAESPARAYNPLFLYGGTGLGKTHLMQAIGQDIISRRPRRQTCAFISSEQFTNQLIQSIADKSTHRVPRAKYRKVDVLLIDDIHFIAGKEATQEEFFHTFNALFDMHRQIVISSDRPPKEISGHRRASRYPVSSPAWSPIFSRPTSKPAWPFSRTRPLKKT